MKVKKRRLWNVLFLLIPCVTMAQVPIGKLKGKVLDESNKPIIGAIVTINGTSGGVVTDLDGAFVIDNNNEGKSLLIDYIGYQQKRVALDGKRVDENMLITLVQDEAILDDVVVNVKGKVSSLREEAFTVGAIDMQKLANSTADLNQVLNRTTGIKIRQEGGVGSDYKFSINGMSGKAVKFFIDGVPLEMLGKGVDMNSLPINMAQRVEIYKGVVPTHLSTDAMGGAVNIISNTSTRNYLDASYTLGSFNTHKVNVNGQLKDDKSGLIMRLNAFYNHADNDYKMRDMKIFNPELNAFEYKDVKRFNDQYKSMFVMTEFGVENKTWADYLFVGVSHSQFDKQIQTGSNQEVVYGGVKKEGDANNYFLRFRKADLFNDRFDVNIYTGYSKSLEKGTDTLTRKYSWDGTYVSSASSELGGVSLNRQHDDRLYTQANLEFRFADSHKLNFNYALDYIKNISYNKLFTDKKHTTPAKMTKQIFSFSYQQDWFEKRLTNVFFGKYYLVDLQKTVWNGFAKQFKGVSIQTGDWGFGFATTFKITDDFGVKGSFEKAYRLLEPEEIFGDGISITSNMDLKPESSMNFNAGLYYNHNFGDHFVRFEGAGYMRDTEDFIYTVLNLHNSTFRYQNLSNILTKGLEGEVNYQYKDIVNVLMNVSYNYAYDNTEFANKGGDVVSATYKKEVPNQPWLYGNIDVGIGKNDVFQKNSRVELNYGVHMTEWFYKNWQSYGNKKNIPTIPRQTIHDLGVSYSMQNGKYNFALNCSNLGNAIAYDNFKLQKQGRAFYFKFRYALK